MVCIFAGSSAPIERYIIGTISPAQGLRAYHWCISIESRSNANEDGVVYYDLFKQDETTYVFLEKYKDQEAQDAHGKTDYFRELGAQMGPFMAGAPEIKVLQSV